MGRCDARLVERGTGTNGGTKGRTWVKSPTPPFFVKRQEDIQPRPTASPESFLLPRSPRAVAEGRELRRFGPDSAPPLENGRFRHSCCKMWLWSDGRVPLIAPGAVGVGGRASSSGLRNRRSSEDRGVQTWRTISNTRRVIIQTKRL
jgi:hypothetical protein